MGSTDVGKALRQEVGQGTSADAATWREGWLCHRTSHCDKRTASAQLGLARWVPGDDKSPSAGQIPDGDLCCVYMTRPESANPYSQGLEEEENCKWLLNSMGFYFDGLELDRGY